MPRRRSLTSQLYRAARLSNDIGALAFGNPGRINRLIRNKAKARLLRRAGFWR